MLIGTSAQPGAFQEEAIRAIADCAERSIVLPLSNPASRCEAHPADILDWTDRRAIVGTGSPFGISGVAQVNNVYIFPSIGLGALAQRAPRTIDGTFLAAARSLGSLTTGSADLLPAISQLRDTARAVATAVAERACEEGLAAKPLLAPIDHALMWKPRYGDD